MKFDNEKISRIHRKKVTLHDFTSVAFSLFVKGPSIIFLVVFILVSLRAGGVGHIMVEFIKNSSYITETGKFRACLDTSEVESAREIDTSEVESAREKPQILREVKNVCENTGEITAGEAEDIYNKTLMNFYVLTVLISGVFIFILMRRK